jgi:hypothetical protein
VLFVWLIRESHVVWDSVFDDESLHLSLLKGQGSSRTPSRGNLRVLGGERLLAQTAKKIWCFCKKIFTPYV